MSIHTCWEPNQDARRECTIRAYVYKMLNHTMRTFLLPQAQAVYTDRVKERYPGLQNVFQPFSILLRPKSKTHQCQYNWQPTSLASATGYILSATTTRIREENKRRTESGPRVRAHTNTHRDTRRIHKKPANQKRAVVARRRSIRPRLRDLDRPRANLGRECGLNTRRFHAKW